MTRLFILLIIVQLVILKCFLIGCFLVDGPRDTVAMLRRQVIFRCSTSDLTDTVEWFFQSGNAKLRLWKTPGFKHKKYFDTFDILGAYGEDADIRYDLLIKHAELEHTGAFVCTVSSKTNKTTRYGRLAVLDVESCRTYFHEDILGHKCRIISAGHVNYTIYWNCAYEAHENISSTFYAIKNIVSDYVKVQVSVLMVMMNLKEKHRLTVCRMDIQAIDQNGIHIIGEEKLSFSISVYQLSHISKLILENYTENCVTGEKGEITLDTEIVFQERYLHLHQLELGHVKALLSYTCEIIRHVTTERTQVVNLKFLNATCEYMGGLKCMKNYTFLLRNENDIFQLSSRQHEYLCDHIKDAEECLWYFKPCIMSKKMTGWMESYRALCSPEYNSLKKPKGIPNNQKCFDQYPQRIELVYKNTKLNLSSFDTKRPNLFTNQFCNHMNMLAGYFCSEHILATEGHPDFGIWYLKFVRLYRQISLRTFSPKIEFKDPYMDVNCEDINSDVQTFKQCVVAKTCSELFGMLVRSLHFGLVIIKEFDDFTNHLCTSDIIFIKNCVDELFYHCDLTTYVTYRSLAFLADDICVRFIKHYPKHHDCFLQLYANVDISKHCIISDLLQNTPSFQSNPTGLATQLCAIGIKYIKCMEQFVSKSCGKDAGALQKWLIKTVFSTAFDDLYCRDIFVKRTFTNPKDYFRGIGNGITIGKVPSIPFIILVLAITSAIHLNMLNILNNINYY